MPLPRPGPIAAAAAHEAARVEAPDRRGPMPNGLKWTGDLPAWLVRCIGLCELSAAIGLILPFATRIKPELTPLAALGLLAIMVLAMAFHISRGEPQVGPMNMALGGLAAFVAGGRNSR